MQIRLLQHAVTLLQAYIWHVLVAACKWSSQIVPHMMSALRRCVHGKQVPQTAASMAPPLTPSHVRASRSGPALPPAFGPTKAAPQTATPSLAAGPQPASVTPLAGSMSRTDSAATRAFPPRAGSQTALLRKKPSKLGRASSTASDSPSLEDFESASASVLRKWGMLKETEEQQAADSEVEDPELVGVLDSAADIRAQPAESKLSQLEPISDAAPEPCMPSPAKPKAAVAQPPTPKKAPSPQKKGFAWMCCRASPTKPELDEAVPAAAEAAGGPIVEELPNGDSYRGEHADGMRQGLAVYRFANGDAFEGDFAQNCMHGVGVYSFANQGCYSGQVRHNANLLCNH